MAKIKIFTKFLFFLILFSFIFLIGAIGVLGEGCNNDGDCPNGERCNSGMCTKSCFGHMDCPWNFPRCDNNVCVSCTSDWDCPPYNGFSGFSCSYEGTCVQKFCSGSCFDPFICVNNKCKQLSNSYCFYDSEYLSFNGVCESMACTQNSNCQPGMECFNNKCVKSCDVSSECNIFTKLYLCNLNTNICESTKTCNFPGDCQEFGSIYTCNNGYCVENCNIQGANCPEGTICNSGTGKCSVSISCNIDVDCIQYGFDYQCNILTHECQKSTIIPTCGDPANCNGYGCDTNGQCRTSCNTNSDCNDAGGFTCNNNQCLLEDCTIKGCTNPVFSFCNTDTKKCEASVQQTPCSVDADCPSGKSCVNSVCGDKVVCASDTDCLVDNVCLNAECKIKCKNSDCTEGYICGVDNQCKTSCTANEDCIADYKCDQNKCVKVEPAEEKQEGCASDNDCTGSGESCVNTKCIDTTSKSCVELGGITCESGYDCDVENINVGSLTSAKCCIPKTNEKAECVSVNVVFVPSQASEVFVKKGPCVNGKRDVYYCSKSGDILDCPAADKTTEDCTAITRKGSSVDISAFSLYAGVVALIAIIIYYLVFQRRDKMKNKKAVRKKIDKKEVKNRAKIKRKA